MKAIEAYQTTQDHKTTVTLEDLKSYAQLALSLRTGKTANDKRRAGKNQLSPTYNE